MNGYIVTNKTFVKSNNKSSLIIGRYFYSLLAFVVLTIIIYLSFGMKDMVLPLLKSLGLSLVMGSVLEYIINIVFKDSKFVNIYKKEHIHIVSLIIGFFGVNINIIVLAISLFIAIMVKKINKNINISACLYGILTIMIYRYFTNDLVLTNDFMNIEINKNTIKNYLISSECLNPILSFIMFIYLFFKKSIKYNIFNGYISTIFLIMLGVGIFSDMHITLPFVVLASNSLIFLSVYTLTDFMNTPTTMEMQIIYGIILGIITSILTFVISPLSVIIPMIICPYILTGILDNNSYKIKYKKEKR